VDFSDSEKNLIDRNNHHNLQTYSEITRKPEFSNNL
jgi:hypothetical protein